METQNLSRTTRYLHWLVGIAILSLIAIGLYMARTEVWALYPIHKSVGVIVFILALIRIGWRWKEGWPKPFGDYPRAEKLAAKATHWLLIIATLALPLSGMLYSGASGHGFGIFGLVLVPENHLATGEVIPYNEALGLAGQTAHTWIGYAVIALLCLHAGGALKHHFVDRDATLRRMLGWQPRG